LLLYCGFPTAEWFTRGARFVAVVTFREVRGSRILAFIEVDAPLALQYEVLISNLSDQMVPSSSIAKTVLVICKTTSLTIDEGCNGRSFRTHLAALNVARPEEVAAWKSLENFTYLYDFGANGSSWLGIRAIDIIDIGLLHIVLSPRSSVRLTYSRPWYLQ
jgi:hypothetical protein